MKGLSVSKRSLSSGVAQTTSEVFRFEAYVITPVIPMKELGKWERMEDAKEGLSVKQWMCRCVSMGT
jgi:hypothetical protein